MSGEVSLAQVLASVSKENDLSGLNVVDKIKDELKKKSEAAYQKWEENQFNINHLFTVQSGYPNESNREVTLLYIATAICATNLVKALLEVEEIDFDKGMYPYIISKLTPFTASGYGGL